MKLHILAIGKLKSAPERALVEDYLKRARSLGRSAGISALEVAEGPEAEREREAQWLLGKLPAKAFAVVLDEGGAAMPSAEFSRLIRRHADGGTSDMAFLIGGPDGHGAAVRKRADMTIAFGPQTWPHRLIRVMLAEQIYRAVTIMVNHPYHRP
jgi:23S rRNA (pseudouridine1915-N3)-methyltransferase